MKLCGTVRRLQLAWIRNITAYINPVRFERQYVKWLKRGGCCINGIPDHIDRSAYIDSADYSKIRIGDNVVISRDVLLLTHDYSIVNAFRTIGLQTWHNGGAVHILGSICIKDNSFVGAKAIILPNTIIGKNCIIGAGAVVKGIIPDGSVVAGNPARIISTTEEYALKFKYNNSLCNYEIPE